MAIRSDDPPRLLLGVEVGAGAVRAGVFDEHGHRLVSAARELEPLRPVDDQAVYRMDSIWAGVGAAVRDCVGVVPDAGARLAGLAFAATPALVLGHDGPAPLEGGADVFAAGDRRAVAEAAEIRAGDDEWLARGGVVGPEHHLARLLWLKRHNPQGWSRLTGTRDLQDELGRRATGVEGNGLTALARRWPWLPPREAGEDGWRLGLLERLDLTDVWTLGTLSNPPLPPLGVHGALTAEAAAVLGLPEGMPVAVGLSDGEAGLLGVLGRGAAGHAGRVLVLVGGRWTNLLAAGAGEEPIPGMAGPFASVLPGLWLHETGQPCSGAALDALLEQHPGGPHLATPDMHEDACRQVLELLESEGPGFAARRHLVPDWQGNSFAGDPALRALATGLGDETGYRAFLEAYYATARALALQVRHVVAGLVRQGHAVDRVALAGGQARNRLLVRLYCDALGVDVVLSEEEETGLLGAAMAAAVAAGVHPDAFVAIERMAPPQQRYTGHEEWRRAHEAAYRIYLKLYDLRNAIAEEGTRLAEIPMMV